MADIVRVLVIDDHELVRETLSERLRREPDIAVIGGVGTVDEALDHLRRLRPDVALLDIHLHDAVGLDVARQARVECLPTRFILVSAFVYDRYIDAAVELGVGGYVSKSEPMSVLVAAIHTVAAGETCFSPLVSQRLLPARDGDEAGPRRSRGGSLTPRQRDVLAHIACGCSKSEVAKLLGVTQKTVETHCEMMMRRLLVNDRVELTRFAIREGLVKA